MCTEADRSEESRRCAGVRNQGDVHGGRQKRGIKEMCRSEESRRHAEVRNRGNRQE